MPIIRDYGPFTATSFTISTRACSRPHIRLGAAMLGNWSNSVDHLVHLLVAFILALPIGWHRAREEHGAGLRTFPLVTMAACGFVQTAISVLGAGATAQANI